MSWDKKWGQKMKNGAQDCNNHTAMAHNSIYVQVQLVKLKLDSIVKWLSIWPVKDKEGFA